MGSQLPISYCTYPYYSGVKIDIIGYARLNEIITYGVRTTHSNVTFECPWMIDGAGLPSNASELLPKLVTLTKKVTEQVRMLAKDEDENLAETSPYDVILPYDQAKALGKTNIDIDRIAAGLPCGSEGFLLMFARWKKLARDLYNERKERYDITQIPDVYDSCKYDLLHNAHLNLEIWMSSSNLPSYTLYLIFVIKNF
ncbi:hypothetical protein F3Y22_tig00113726pilonHSYRG00196 [Hibiscus syriacus]|uniref:Uncharacterized protein n=1 Tax=Hibiscus syriacus TaxID=106335 RepID=A0A6A2XSC8_HIBSY|nr:hypothetical protein F3Y22_tig00113726pilonHSYRG00196 [Hibiscus syriacus]